MMRSFKRNILILVAILICIAGFILIKMIFEGSSPVIEISTDVKFLTKETPVTINVSDKGRGLRRIEVVMNQEGKVFKLLDKRFPSKGFLNLKGEHKFHKVILVDPKRLPLSQGKIEIKISAWDYSKRRGGDGNIAVKSIGITVDTVPPVISPLSRLNYVRRGGAGLILYRVSSDTAENGVYVDKWFFQGFEPQKVNNIRLCYFGIPVKASRNPSLYIWARDIAGNETKTNFNYRIKERRFRKRKITLSDRFIEHVVEYFSGTDMPEQDSDIDKYLFINREIRKRNHEKIKKLCSQSVSERLWECPWLRMKNSATMANFGDIRYYYYKGEKIDEQTHMGVDLASLSHAPVPASNRGRVIFADKLGIYGNAVIIDHGQGILSLYGHMSSIIVQKGQMVEKGDIIGYTGQSGLAGGDHLHFAIMINGVFVNPVEWWDPHWIQDNIERKLALLNDKR